jgi:hypothetical protein
MACNSVELFVLDQRKKLLLPKLSCVFLERGQWMMHDLTYEVLI